MDFAVNVNNGKRKKEAGVYQMFFELKFCEMCLNTGFVTLRYKLNYETD